MKSEYAFKKTLNNFKASFSRDTDEDLIKIKKENDEQEHRNLNSTHSTFQIHIGAQNSTIISSSNNDNFATDIEQLRTANGAIEQTKSDAAIEQMVFGKNDDEQLMKMQPFKQHQTLIAENVDISAHKLINIVNLNVNVKQQQNDNDDNNNIVFSEINSKFYRFMHFYTQSKNAYTSILSLQISIDNRIIFNDFINLMLLWPPKQLQFNQSEMEENEMNATAANDYVLPDNNNNNNKQPLSKMVNYQIDSINRNNKMYQIINKINAIDNNMDKKFNHKDKVNKKNNILNATETFCDNYKIDLNVAKSDKNSSKNLKITINFSSSMENDRIIIAKKTKSMENKHYNDKIEKANENNEQNAIKTNVTVNNNTMKLPMPAHHQRDGNHQNTKIENYENVPATKISTSHISFDKLIELIDSEPKRIRQWEQQTIQLNGTKPMLARLLRLCGGGEQAINNGTGGWGSPPSGTTTAPVGGSNATASSWGVTNQAPPQQWGNSSPQQAPQQVQQAPQQQPPQHSQQAPHPSGQPAHHPETLHQQISQQQQQAPRQPIEPIAGAAVAAVVVGRIPQPGPPQPTVQPQPSQATGVIPEPSAEQAAVMIGSVTSNIATKNQLEQLTTLREALFSQDGWGCQHVNQDTNWDVPGSPEPMGAGNIVKPDPTQAVATAAGVSVAPWKPNINNGTELWEANLRNGGQPPAPAVQKPWGHTPSTNLGGTWGEDDDGLDSANVWASNSAVNVNAANTNVGQNTTMWPPAAGANTANTSTNAGPGVVNIPTDIKRDNEWTSNNASANNWGNSMQPTPRDVRNVSGNQMDIRNPDPRDVRLSNTSHFNIPMVHPSRENLIREISTRGDVRGDLRGISGRLNGTSEMWGHHNLSQPQGTQGQQASQNPQAQQSQQQPQSQQPQHGQMPMNKMSDFVLPQQQNAQINNQQKDLSQSKPTGWEEPSPPTQRRNIPNYDDGTSLWGQQQQAPQQQSNQQQAGQQQQPVPLPQNRVNRLQVGSGSNWDDKNSAMGGNTGGNVTGAWDAQTPGVWQQQQKNKQLMGSGADDLNEWHGIQTQKQQQNKMAALEIIRNSKQYRMLFDMGFKKEEIEVALRATNLNLDDSIEILNQSRSANSMDAWRRHDEHNTGAGNFDHNNFPQRYPAGPQMPFPPNNNPNLLNSIGVSGANSNPCLNAIGNMQPMQQKFMSQGAHNASGTGFNQGLSGINQPLSAGNSGNSTPAAGQPTSQQLRMLVQQIQMAVQAGYLNHQILNQPLAPTTLVLLNQLLTHIKQLQVNQANMNRGNNHIHIALNISKLKQQISGLQNQIAQQQAAYVNKQPGGNHNMGGNDFVPVKNPNAPGIGIANIGNVSGGVGPSANDYLRGQHDPINSLQGTFTDMSMTKEPPNSFQNSSSQQSRLNQWKLPNFDKDSIDNATDFSRAPGTTSKSTMSTSNSVIGSLGLQNDGTWSSGRSDGWPDSTPDSENKDWPSSQQSPASAFTDLVPEFEPGKPWKGSQMKTIEDDPSITPGSVARSPLSIAAKEADLFAPSSKTSPTDLPPLSLSSSTWSFNPSGSNQPHFTSSSKGSWSDGVTHQMGNELWSAPMTNKSRGPPPGLGNNNKGNLSGANATTPNASSGTNGWIGSSLSNRVGGSNNWISGSWPSTWLLLKNMTAQIDGSTLRTLCMQHGPLQHFHLYLNHSLALCKYSTREEANKAQMALNNCVLGNTTICAESPCESEVQNILQHLGVPNQQQPPQPQIQQSQQHQPVQQSSAASTTSQWRPSSQNTSQFSTKPTGSDTWGASSVWPTPNTTPSFWTGLDAVTTERGTPSSLNSLLPENLLGNELN